MCPQPCDEPSPSGRAQASDGGDEGDGQKLAVVTDPAGHTFCLCANEQDEPIRVFGAVRRCPDPAALARFSAALLTWVPSTRKEADKRLG